jgi:hypothetical protein
MRSSIVRAIVIATIVSWAIAPAAQAREAVVATLDGQAITLARAGGLDCHDFDYPVLRCFDSVAQLDAAVAVHVGGHTSSAPGAALSTGYVVVFQDIAYSGAAKVLSSNVPWLSDIGWNDKISSFKSYGATGKFYENSPSGGFIYYYWSTTQVSDVGSAYNDRFSAFYIN